MGHGLFKQEGDCLDPYIIVIAGDQTHRTATICMTEKSYQSDESDGQTMREVSDLLDTDDSGSSDLKEVNVAIHVLGFEA